MIKSFIHFIKPAPGCTFGQHGSPDEKNKWEKVSENPKLMIRRMGLENRGNDLQLPRPLPALSSCLLWVSFPWGPWSSTFSFSAVIKPESADGAALALLHGIFLELSFNKYLWLPSKLQALFAKLKLFWMEKCTAVWTQPFSACSFGLTLGWATPSPWATCLYFGSRKSHPLYLWDMFPWPSLHGFPLNLSVTVPHLPPEAVSSPGCLFHPKHSSFYFSPWLAFLFPVWYMHSQQMALLGWHNVFSRLLRIRWHSAAQTEGFIAFLDLTSLGVNQLLSSQTPHGHDHHRLWPWLFQNQCPVLKNLHHILTYMVLSL